MLVVGASPREERVVGGRDVRDLGRVELDVQREAPDEVGRVRGLVRVRVRVGA